MKASEPLYEWLDKRFPERWRLYLNRYSTSTETIAHTTQWNQILKSYAQTVILEFGRSGGHYPRIISPVGATNCIHVYPETFITNSVLFGSLFFWFHRSLWALVFKRGNRKCLFRDLAEPEIQPRSFVITGIVARLIAILLMAFLLNFVLLHANSIRRRRRHYGTGVCYFLPDDYNSFIIKSKTGSCKILTHASWKEAGKSKEDPTTMGRAFRFPRS